MSDTFGGMFDRQTLVKVGLGFVVALAVLALLTAGIGTRRVGAVLADANLAWVGVGCLATLACLTAWARAWHEVLEVAGIDVSMRRLVVTYYAATFANYVTPLGQAGGEPFIAYVLSRDTDASYEDSLASVVTADLLNLLPFFTFSGVGFAALLLGSALPAQVRPLAFGLAGMAVGIPLLAAGGWRYRERLGGVVVRLLAPVARRTRLFSLDSLRDRLRDLNAAFERIARDRGALARALVFSYIGWVFFTLPLYFSIRALDLTVDPLLVLFVVPASTLAGIVPSPGGLGGVEAALLVLLVGLAGLTQVPAFAVALLYRVASYWFALVVGGASALYVIYRN
jgi:hypothetical protein